MLQYICTDEIVEILNTFILFFDNKSLLGLPDGCSSICCCGLSRTKAYTATKILTENGEENGIPT